MEMNIKSMKEFPIQLWTSLLMSFITEKPRSQSAVLYENFLTYLVNVSIFLMSLTNLVNVSIFSIFVTDLLNVWISKIFEPEKNNPDTAIEYY